MRGSSLRRRRRSPGACGVVSCARKPTSTKRAAARHRRAVRPRRRRGGAACRLSRRTRAARLHARRPEGHRQGDARLSHGALRARASGPGSGRGARGDVARRRSGASGGAARGGAGAWRSSRPGAHAQREGRAAPADRGRRRAAHDFVLRLDRGEGGWRIASSMRSTNSTDSAPMRCSRFSRSRRERALLLLVCHSAARVLPTLRSRCRVLAMRPLAEADVAARAGGGDRHGRRPIRDVEAAAAAADGSVARALAFSTRTPWRCASARSTSSTVAARSTPTRCMRSATRSRAPTRSRSPPSSIPSTPGCRGGSTPGRHEAADCRDWRGWRKRGSASIAAARDAETYNLERKPLGLQRVRLACRGHARLIPMRRPWPGMSRLDRSKAPARLNG